MAMRSSGLAWDVVCILFVSTGYIKECGREYSNDLSWCRLFGLPFRFLLILFEQEACH